MLPQEVKRAMKKVVGLANQLADILEDGKIAGNEWMSLAMTSPMIPSIVSDAKAALKAKAKFTPEVSKEISLQFEKDFDIQNDVLEAKVEKAISLLSKTHTQAVEVVDLYQEWEDWIQSLKAA